LVSLPPGLPLRSGLRLMVAAAGGDFVIDEERQAILITTRTAAASTMSFRVHRLGGNLANRESRKVINHAVVPPFWRQEAGSSTVSQIGSALVVFSNAQGHQQIADSLSACTSALPPSPP